MKCFSELLVVLTLTCSAGADCQGEACDADATGFVQWQRFQRLKEMKRQRHGHYGHYGHHYPTTAPPTTSPPTTSPPVPNIFLVIIDDMGFNQVGFRANETGNFDVVTPNIDDLAGKGIIMDRFYATPWCAPSRAALQSGRLDALNPHVSNNIWNWDPNANFSFGGDSYTTPFIGGMQPDTVTLGNKLADLGYATHLNGKWGIGGGAWANTPLGMGYSSFLGWFGDSMESCDGTEPGLAVGGAGPLMDALPSFWRQDSQASVLAPWCEQLNKTNMLDEDELFVGCRTFKAELDDVADEVIRLRSREIIVQHDYEKAPLFLVHALQLMHLPIQYPERFATRDIGQATEPQNEDLRAATYGALTYVDWVIGDLVEAFREQDQYENTIILITSDNGGSIYAGTANNNFPLRGGKFNNFDGGQRVNAFFTGGWVEAALRERSLSPFRSDTVMAINDVPETLLCMVAHGTGMGHPTGPLIGVALWNTILDKEQQPRRIVYSDTMELIVTPDIIDLKKYWFVDKDKVIADGNWSAHYPNNTDFIPDFAYFYVRPCGKAYCYFNLSTDPSEQNNTDLNPLEELALREETSDAWNNNVINTSRVKKLNSSNAYPSQLALWTHYGASGPFLTRKAEPVMVRAQCWCDWIDDGVAPESVSRVIFNLYLGARCTDIEGARFVAGALECDGPLKLTQAPAPFSFEDGMWRKVGFKTENFSFIEQAQWDYGPAGDVLPLLFMKWNIPTIMGLQTMNARLGFKNWPNIAKYPFNLAIHDHCPSLRIFTAPTPMTQITWWLLAGGIFSNPTAGAGNGDMRLLKVLQLMEEYLDRNITNPDDGKVRGCLLVSEDGMVCPTLDNKPPLLNASDVQIRPIDNCLDECILYDPNA